MTDEVRSGIQRSKRKRARPEAAPAFLPPFFLIIKDTLFSRKRRNNAILSEIMKRVLHIGPGKSGVLPHTFSPLEWEEVRFDLDRITEPHIVGNITDMGMIENETFDAVFSSHTIEHLYPLEVKKALEECLRVLRSDGFLLIVCPDLEAVAAEIVKGNLLGTL